MKRINREIRLDRGFFDESLQSLAGLASPRHGQGHGL